MPSTFTWLDYSEHERRKMLDVIDLFGEKTTRDELGIGGIRDAFADLMFPGTTTIQTVAKYFLFVPWMYVELERKHVPSAKVKDRARKIEITLAKELGTAGGVIGRRAKENLQRLPSSVYWQGLQAWGIRRFSGSQDDYQRSRDLFYSRRKARASTGGEFDGEGTSDEGLSNWHDGLPEPKESLPAGETLDLSETEAAYLRERVLTSCPDSVLAHLLRHRVTVADAEFVWQVAAEFPDRLSQQIEHAQNFSETIHGAQLLYNLILAEQSGFTERIDHYRTWMAQWWELIDSRRRELQQWDMPKFWSTVHRVNPRINGQAKHFARGWIERVLVAPDLNALADAKAARQLIEAREAQIKGALARTKNQRARELWTGAAGSLQLDLRWRTTRRIVTDILQGLEVNVDA
jgi:hypothetical protein